MSDQWIKMRVRLREDPDLGRLAAWMLKNDMTTERSLAMVRRLAVGVMLDVWGWAHEKNSGGLIPEATAEDIDFLVDMLGLGAELVALGWFEESPEGLRVVKHEKYVGSLPDARAKSADRVRALRERRAAEKLAAKEGSQRDSSVTSADVTRYTPDCNALLTRYSSTSTSTNREEGADARSTPPADDLAAHSRHVAFAPPEHVPQDWLEKHMQAAEVLLSTSPRWPKVHAGIKRRILKLGVIQMAPDPPKGKLPPAWALELSHATDVGHKVAEWVEHRIKAWDRTKGSLNAYLGKAAIWGPDSAGWVPPGTPQQPEPVRSAS